jgi:hypothetical protein
METGNQPYMGRDSASVIWNSTGIYSPDGGYLNYGWKNAFWNAEARVNQDGCFRNTNLIVAGGLSTQNRPIGTSARPTDIKIANGGTISSSANVFHASNFSNRGGLFTSSSAWEGDGVNNTYVDIWNGDISDFEFGTGPFTIEAWVRGTSAGGLIGSYWGSDLPMYQIDIGDGAATNMRVLATGSGGASLDGLTKVDAKATTNVIDGKWHHVVGVRDTSAGLVKLYIDGKLESESSDAATVAEGGNVDNGQRKRIGARGSYGELDGVVARASFWKSALTSAQIRTMMFQDFDDATTTNCVAWYQFNEGQGTTVSDMTGSGNTGNFNGSSAWANGGTWSAGNQLSGSSANLYIGKGTYSTDFASSYYALENTYLISGAKWTSKAHSGSNDYYINAYSGTTFNFSQIGNEPQPIVRNAVPPTGGSDVTLLDTEVNGGGNYTFIFDEGENDLGTAKDCKQLIVESGVTFKVTTGVDYYTQDFKNRGTWEHGAAFDGTIHDDGSLPTEYEPIDLKQHISDPPIDAGLAID